MTVLREMNVKFTKFQSMFTHYEAARQIRDDEVEFCTRMNFSPFFFTFGMGQAFPKHVACVWAPDEGAARVKMNSLFGSCWSFCYDLDQMIEYHSKWSPGLIGEYVID